MLPDLNSLRMHAERDGQHISGAERLLGIAGLENAAVEMLQRALSHPRGRAQKVTFHVEPVNRQRLISGQLLDLTTNLVADWQQGRQLALRLLSDAGIPKNIAETAMQTLAAGAAPNGQSMRGAMLIDADSGERLEMDQLRGVRASRMDLAHSVRQQFRQRLAEFGLDNPHVLEAITLATKVSMAPGLVAELCWSDDPDYLAGYVAAQGCGYQRINLLKPQGEERGGRAFFVRRPQAQVADLVNWLEKMPLLIERLGQIRTTVDWRERR